MAEEKKFQELEEALDFVSRLDDYPASVDGFSTEDFKFTFDKAGIILKNHMNSLIRTLNSLLIGTANFLTGGTMTGPIHMNGQRLNGLNAPTEDDEAANKGYADSRNPESRIHNGDFTQWVAQEGIGGKHGNDTYAGDRWILDSGTVTGEANENGNGYKNIKLNGTIRQIVANPPAAGTAFVVMVSGTATIIYADGEITITSNGGVIKNVDLFEGIYTESNRPAHRSKGYGVELTECLLYFQKVSARITQYATAAVNATYQESIQYSPMRTATPHVALDVPYNYENLAYGVQASITVPGAISVVYSASNPTVDFYAVVTLDADL